MLTAYAVALAALLLAAGSLVDIWGRRRVFITGLVVFTLSSLGCALAPSVAALDVLRVVQGIGGAFAFVPTMAIIAAHFEGPARTRAIADAAAGGGRSRRGLRGGRPVAVLYGGCPDGVESAGSDLGVPAARRSQRKGYRYFTAACPMVVTRRAGAHWAASVKKSPSVEEIP